MTAHNGNTEQDERGLLPYPVIIAATKGDPEAMKIVVQHYESYIASLSMRKLRDERGNLFCIHCEPTYESIFSYSTRKSGKPAPSKQSVQYSPSKQHINRKPCQNTSGARQSSTLLLYHMPHIYASLFWRFPLKILPLHGIPSRKQRTTGG